MSCLRDLALICTYTVLVGGGTIIANAHRAWPAEAMPSAAATASAVNSAAAIPQSVVDAMQELPKTATAFRLYQEGERQGCKIAYEDGAVLHFGGKPRAGTNLVFLSGLWASDKFGAGWRLDEKTYKGNPGDVVEVLRECVMLGTVTDKYHASTAQDWSVAGGY